MKLPNFLVIGTSKAGTTSLYKYLEQHPQIYMSPKTEPRFFAFEGDKLDYRGPYDERLKGEITTNIENYKALFQGVTDEKAIGEISPSYLYIPKTPRVIKHYLPRAKLFAILRNPIDRAYSSFLAEIRDCREPSDDFSKAVQDEEKRIRNKWSYVWHYTKRGFYYNQVKRYYDLFDRDQIRIYLYEDWKRDNLRFLRELFRDLDVDETFEPDVSIKYNVSLIPRSYCLHKQSQHKSPIISHLNKVMPEKPYNKACNSITDKNLVKPELPAKLRSELAALYREDILNLQTLIERDLSTWQES